MSGFEIISLDAKVKGPGQIPRSGSKVNVKVRNRGQMFGTQWSIVELDFSNFSKKDA